LRDPLNHSNVLIVSDDTEFARAVVARWRTERRIPEITLATSGVWQPASARGYDLVIVGPIQNGKLPMILSSLNTFSGTAAVCLAEDEKDALFLRAEYPNLLVVLRLDGWSATMILIANEVLRRIEAVSRAQRAERLALESQSHAALGRYMLEVRPSVNNALTSVLGNADLLLLNLSETPKECLEQIRAIHTMALRLNEIMQRFSSLASELRACEKESHTETDVLAPGPVGGS
jgi:signal transduction histidine kinase